VWGGIGLYRWNGTRLTSNSVEQDYLSRAVQLASRAPMPTEAPAIAPWDTPVTPPDLHCEIVVREWLQRGEVATTSGVFCDHAWAGAAMSAIVDQQSLTINDLFSCGSAVAFHLSQLGKLLPDFAERPADVGRAVTLHMAGIVHVDHGRVSSGRIIRNRLELRRSLAERS
jgi:hypothetical protein